MSLIEKLSQAEWPQNRILLAHIPSKVCLPRGQGRTNIGSTTLCRFIFFQILSESAAG